MMDFHVRNFAQNVGFNTEFGGIAKQIVLPQLIETFSHQFVADNADVWAVIDNPTLARPV